MKQGVFWLACGLILVSVACSKQDAGRVVILGTTTSVGNSGLLEVLLPAFEQVSGARVRGHLVGSGRALRMLERGQADVVISHAPEMEAKFLEAHPEWSYRKLMYNDFLLVGPLDDPAAVLSAPSIEAAIRRIVEGRARFVSRGDESGTHTRERQLLTLAGVTLPVEQVVVTGQGMSRTLRIASAIGAYTLTDATTFARVGDTVDLQPVFQGGPRLLNAYAVLMDASDPHDDSRALAASLFQWLADGGGRELIASFRVSSAATGFVVWPTDRTRDQPSALPF